MKSLVLALALLAFVAGCATTGAPDHDSFRFVGGAKMVTARMIEPGVLQSSVGQVERFPDGFRGRWHGDTVDLRAHDGKIDGFIGGQRTELHVDVRPDGYVVRGIYREHLGQLDVTAQRIEGSVGYGWIGVERVGEGQFSGFMPERSGQRMQFHGLVVPAGFSALPREEQVVYLALLIGA